MKRNMKRGPHIALALVMIYPANGLAQETSGRREPSIKSLLPEITQEAGREPFMGGFFSVTTGALIGGGATPTAGVHYTHVKPRGLAVDSGLNLLLRGLANDALFLQPEFSLGYAFSTSNTIFIPRAGIGGLILTDSRDAQGAFGFQAGATLIIHRAGPVGVRLDGALHSFTGAPILAASFGIGITFLDRKGGGPSVGHSP